MAVVMFGPAFAPLLIAALSPGPGIVAAVQLARVFQFPSFAAPLKVRSAAEAAPERHRVMEEASRIPEAFRSDDFRYLGFMDCCL